MQLLGMRGGAGETAAGAVSGAGRMYRARRRRPRRRGLIFRHATRRSTSSGITCWGLAQADMQTRMLVFELLEAVRGHEIEQAFELLHIHAGHRKACGGGLLVLGFVCG